MMAGWEPKGPYPHPQRELLILGKKHKEEGLDSDDAQKLWKLFPFWTAGLPLWLLKNQSAVYHVPQ